MGLQNHDWRALALHGCVTVVVLAALALPSPTAHAQGAPRPPKRKSFSNRPKPAKQPPAETRRQPSEDELTEAVLGDVMNQVFDYSDEHFHHGEYNHVINLDRIVAQGDPHNMEAYANPSWLLWSMGRNGEAEAALAAGIAANPTTYYMFDEMGNFWFLNRKDPKSAIPYFEKASRLDCPGETWHSLANCYEKVGQWDKAVAAWEKATLYPNNGIVQTRLKRARLRLAQQPGGK